MLPQSLLRASIRASGDRIVPRYFSALDEPWLSALIEECRDFAGRRRSEWQERLREPLRVRAPKSKLRIAIHQLDALCRERPAVVVPAKEARAAVFREAAQGSAPRADVLARVAKSLGVTPLELEAALFADLKTEQRVAELARELRAAELASDANLSIVSSLVRRAASVRIVLWGNSRALVRHAQRMGLICNVSLLLPRSPNAEGAARLVLDVSGPLSLFHHTDVYGRALSSLVPRLAECDGFELTAACALARGSQFSTLLVRSSDPIASGRASPRPERRIEQRFERDFRRIAPDWQILPEPKPVKSGDTLIFPDFELVHRRDAKRRFFLEIVGFWTHRYLSDKLERLRAVGIERLVLCVDQRGDCSEDPLPTDARLVAYRTRIDARSVLAVIER